MPPRRDARLVGAVLLLANVGLVCVVWNSQQRQWLFEDWQEAEEEVMATGDFNARDPLKAPQPSKGFLSEWRKEAPRRRLDSTGTVFKPDKKRAFPANRVKFGTDGWTKFSKASIKHNSKLRCRKWAVLTTVFAPSEAVRRMLYLSGWCLVVVGDQFGQGENYTFPTTRGENNAVFLSFEDQLRMDLPLSSSLPWRSFGRKNVGYLYAIANGAEIIWDFDDDNMLKFWIEGAATDENLWLGTFTTSTDSIVEAVEPSLSAETSSFNPYPLLGAPLQPCWPRGFPLSKVNSPTTWNVSTPLVNVSLGDIGVLQSLADLNPDVDAVFRMTKASTKFSFSGEERKVKTVLLSPQNAFSPCNAQATLHRKQSFYALYLPVTVAGRVSDIWRSYVTQALFRLTGTRVGFLPRPLVIQKRNPHDNSADFSAEIPLYTKTDALIEFLNGWVSKAEADLKLGRSWESIVENLWIEMYERDFVQMDDVTNVQLWLEALAEIGYESPSGSIISAKESADRLSRDYSLGRSLSGMPRNNCETLRSRPPVQFWTSDLHDGTRLDAPTTLAFLGQRVVVAGLKGAQSPYPNALRRTEGIVVGSAIPDPVAKYTDHASDVDNATISLMAEYVARDRSGQLGSTDAFFCSFTAAMCELFLEANRTLVVLAAHRYNLGRCSVERWTLLNRRLTRLSKDDAKGNVVGAVSRYDLEYLRHYTGISNLRLVSSFSGFYTAGHRYEPTRNEILIFHLKSRKSLLVNDIEKTSRHQFKFRSVYDVYHKYTLTDLVSHRAVVFEPYSVMSFKFTELYSLSVPMFVPSAYHWKKVAGLGQDRTSTSVPYCDIDKDLWWKMPPDPDSPHNYYNPNAEFTVDPESEMYWLQFSDFYDWPHVTYFDNATHLAKLMVAADFIEIHKMMKKENEIRKALVTGEWCDIVGGIQSVKERSPV